MQALPSRIFLIGPMAAGKSAIGRLLADRLGYEFLDSDQEIEARSGADIAWIFDVEGEAGFRRRETQVLSDIALKNKIVVATGGGAILNPVNRQLMREQSVVVYLQASLDTLVSRTEKDKKRPLLQGVDRRSVLQDLLQKRAPLYESTAHILINSEQRNMRHTVSGIHRDLLEYSAKAI